MGADGRRASYVPGNEWQSDLYEKNPELIVVTRELGCGMVPIDPQDRKYRETHGQICTELAKRADEVVRVICGVGMKLK